MDTQENQEKTLSPLEGVRVISMAHLYPGPYCTMLLGDLGADIIVVEQTGSGDPARLIPGYLSIINRNKKSITLNLKSEKGKEICYKLASTSDIFIEGYRPGVVKRLGVDYASIRNVNPEIIYCSISGYGQNGPYRDYPAHDITYQGVAGILAPTESTIPIHNPWIAIADLSSAMFATLGIFAALRVRERFGKGQFIDVSMLDSLISWMSVPLGIYFTLGYAHRTNWPAYGCYKTKDSKYITLSMTIEDHFWVNLCCAIGREDLGKMPLPLRVEKAEELRNILQEAFLSRKRVEWLEILKKADVPCGPVLTLSEVVKIPQVVYRDMIVEVEDKQGKRIKQVAHPLKFSETPARIRRLPPVLGEHTEEVLQGLGYEKKQLEEFRKEGII